MSDAAEIGKRFIEKIDALAREGKFYGFTIWPTNGGFQINLAANAPNNWRIRRAEVPSEGIDLVCAMDYMDVDVFKTKSQRDAEAEMLAPRDFDEAALPPEAREAALAELDELDEIERDEARAAARDEAGIFD